MIVTFTPTLSEHLRARRAMSAVVPVFDAYGRLPWFVAFLMLAILISEIASSHGPWWSGLGRVYALSFFFFGIGIGARRRKGKTLTYALGDDGIDVLQPRHRWHVAWSRVRQVAETEEFFVVATDRAAFYLAKRAADEAALRDLLHRRGG